MIQPPSALIHWQVKTQWEMGKVAKAFIFLLATYSVQVNDSCLVNNSCYCNDTKIQCIKPQCMQVSFCPDLKVVANLLDAC